MLTAEQNERLTRTGPNTPMGEVFRQYWQPTLLSRELEPDGAPKRINLLGEDYIAFRDSAGKVGVVSPRCSHRGANLFFGRNEHCGLRCAYHGWQFDVTGQCIDIPTLPSELAEKTKPKAAINALQVAEFGDTIWTYAGSDSPPLPQFEFATVPAEHRFVSKKLQQCNWAQAVEGGLDTAHFSYLHAAIKDGEKTSLIPSKEPKGSNEPASIARFRWLIEDGMPRFTIMQHDAGLVLGAARTADNDETYWRVTQFLMPNHSLAPNTFAGELYQGNTWVPIDDEHCWIYCFVWNPDRPLTDSERNRFAAGSGIFAEVDEHFVPVRNRDNDYLLDRDHQKHSNFTGITGISEQDAAIADSQGPIADRTQEILGQTDLGIARFRQLMLSTADAVERGEVPRGLQQPQAYAIRPGDAMAKSDVALPDVLDERFGGQAGVGLSAL